MGAGGVAEAGAGEGAVADGGGIERLPVLGVGLGYRRPLAREIHAHAGEIDFLEIIAEQFVEPTAAERRELARLASRFPLVPHALGLSIGTAEPVPDDYLDGIAAIVREVAPPWWSDHLAMTRVGDVEIGHLAPVPHTRQAIDVVCANVAQVRARVATPLVLENIAHPFVLPAAEMDEARFLSEILRRTDAGLLLDLMNLHANCHNDGTDPYEFLASIPLERVVQVHVIGGHRAGGVVVDSHSHRTPDAVWAMLDHVARRTEIKAVLVEWDEQFPAFDVILAELDRARRVLAHARRPVSAAHA